MRVGWQSRPLEECIEPVVYTMKVQRKDFLADGAYPVVSQEEAFVNGFWDQEADIFRVERPVVVFGDHTRALKYIDFDFVLGADGVKVLKPKSFLHPRFFYYQLHTAKLDSLGYARHYRLLKEHQVSYPAYPEQQRIVAILDEAFEGISTAKANAEKNLQNARCVLSSELERVFGDASCSPWIPIRNFGEVFDGPHATPKTVDSGPIFLGISALKDGLVDLGETRHVTPEDFLRWTRRVTPRGGDIVFSYETRLGQAALIPEGFVCCLGRRMGLVRVDASRVDPRFFAFQFVSPPFRRFLDSRVIRGATVDRIGLKEFPSFPVWLPDLSKQQGVADRLDGLRVETRNLELVCEKKLAAFDELKKSLLQQAFNGQLSGVQ